MDIKAFAEFEASILSQLAYMKEEINRPAPAAASAGPGGAPPDDVPAPFTDYEQKTWPRPTRAEYDAGASLATTTQHWRLDLVGPLARVGRTMTGQLARSYEDLMAAYDEIGRLERKEVHYFADYCKDAKGEELSPSWGSEQAWVILCPLANADYHDPMSIAGESYRCTRIAGRGLAETSLLFASPGSGALPSGF